MIITTTPTIEGYKIVEYLGVVMGDLDVQYGFERKLSYEAEKRGADAVIDCKLIVNPRGGGHLGVKTAIGTAVKISKIE